MEVIIVTGLSGAGRTKAKEYFEDRDYYSIDNMPPTLIKNFIELSSNEGNAISKVCFVMDLRGGAFFEDFKEALNYLRDRDEIKTKLLFIEANSSTLVKRYNETRRTHPLSLNGVSLKQAIINEQEMLLPIRSEADFIIDTSKMKVAEFFSNLDEIFDDKGKKKFTLNFMSFGYKKGIPEEADWVMDARFISNPYYIPDLKNKTGKDKEVKEFVLNEATSKKFLNDVEILILGLIDAYIKEGKYSLTVAIGCTGGQHRSVVISTELYTYFLQKGYIVTLEHREL